MEGSAGGGRVCYRQLLEKSVNFCWLLVGWSDCWNPEEPQPQSTLHLPLFPLGLPWVHGYRHALDAGAQGRECRTFLRWAMPAEGQENQQSLWGARGFPQVQGRATTDRATAGELRNVPLWLSRLSVREAAGFAVADRGRQRDLHKAWTAEGATAEPAPRLTAGVWNRQCSQLSESQPLCKAQRDLWSLPVLRSQLLLKVHFWLHPKKNLKPVWNWI